MSYPGSSSMCYRKPESGVISVGVVDDIILKDDRRNREVPIRIYYPQEPGSFPVIIFSHGAGGSKESFSYLSRFWASYGYICIHPTHLGSDSSVLKRIGLQALLEMTSAPEFWSVRPRDISFIIDSFEELEQRVPEVRGKINQSVIAVSGHSYGAYTTMLLAGAVVTMPGGEAVSFQDERSLAFLAISPPGSDRLGLNRDSWDKIYTPMLTISGSKDEGWEGKSASWRLEPFKSMPSGDKYHVLVEGANHFSFDLRIRTLRAGTQMRNRDSSPQKAKELFELDRNSRIKVYLKSASITFWDAYLKSKTAAKEYLGSDVLKIDSNGEATLFSK